MYVHILYYGFMTWNSPDVYRPRDLARSSNQGIAQRDPPIQIHMRYIHMYIYIYIYTYIHTYTHIRYIVYTHTTYTYVHTSLSLYMYIHVYTYVCVYIYIYIYMHTRILVSNLNTIARYLTGFITCDLPDPSARVRRLPRFHGLCGVFYVVGGN